MKRASIWLAFSFMFLGGGLLESGTILAGDKKGKDGEPAYRKTASVEGIDEYELTGNGLKFLLFPDPSASTVTINLTIKVGSRHEGYGETGMAHLLEHMLFKGSPKFPHPDKALQEHGAESNGTTWVDRTNYYETMPATEKNLRFGIELEADRLVNSFIKREDLVSEMTVVRNEFEIGENNEEGILNQRMMAVAFEWHNYGKSTIGNRSDIERVPIENLQAFYKKYYHTNNSVLIIAGKFDEKKAIDLIVQSFGPIPRSKHKIEQPYTSEPAQDGERTVILRRAGKVAVVGVLYHIPAAAHPDTAGLEVLGHVLGHTPSGRLYKALVEKKLASSVSVDVSAWHDPGVLEITARVASGVDPEQVRDIILKEVEELKANPATAEEVTRAKTKFASDFERKLANSKRVGLDLSEWVGAGDWRLLFVQRDRIAKVSPEDVNRVAESYLRQSNRTVGLFIPSKTVARTPIPETPDIAVLVKEFKGTKEVASGEIFDPTPENIEKRVKRVELSNGLKVSLLPKKTRGETVVATMNLRFGNEESLKPYLTTANFMGPLMTRGTKKRTRVEISDQLDKLKSSLSASSGVGNMGVSLQSKRENLSAVLDLLKELLHEPTFPEAELDILRRNQRQSIEKSMLDPQGLAFKSLMRTLHPYAPDDIRYTPTFQESLDRLEKVSRDDIVKLYQEQVSVAVGEIALVGDFDADETVKKLEEVFAGLKKAKAPAYQRIDQKTFTSVKGTTESIDTPDKEAAVVAAAHLFAMRDDDPAYPALELANYILGGNFNSRLVDRLRQKEGLCYGAGSQVNVSSRDKYGMFLVYGICNPENVNKVDKGAVEEVVKLVKKGVETKEMELARKGYLEEQRVDRSRDIMLAAMLNELTNLGRTFEYIAAVEKKIGGLTLEEVNRAVAEAVHPDRLVIVRAGDLSKKADPKKEKK